MKRSRRLAPVDRDVVVVRFDLIVACENSKGRTWAARLRDLRALLLEQGYVLEARHRRSFNVDASGLLDRG